ncbi:MAG: DNA internalization-related competence protein ComEC/Rec2 [SAR202 cluster bacterium Io17-Chloro-G9]|nr:MAG: DNA internalization-related competence protein ComEC/Rec2 [SAR202 cluster bacterium Io17-Chloro-G9]
MKLAALVAAWLAGAWLGLRADAAPLPVLLLLLAAIPAGILLRMARLSLWPAVLVGLVLLSLFRIEATEDAPVPLVSQDSQPVAVQGRVINDPEATRRQAKFQFAVEAIDLGGGFEPLESRVLVYADPPESLLTRRDPFFRIGDNLLVEGLLERPKPFGGFDYPAYLENQGIFGILRSREVALVAEGSPGNWRGKLFDLRRKLSSNIENALPEPQSAVGRAMLLGYRGQIPPDLKDDFRKTGASHLLAISGLHVGVMLVLSMGMAGILIGRRRHLYLLLPLASIWSYALISGSPDSVIRAAVMGSVFLSALALGRPSSVLPGLALAAAVMVGITPGVLERVSFQLSFAAVAGISLALPYQAKVAEWITNSAESWASPWQPWVRAAATWMATTAIMSVAATLATWPLVAFYFDRIPFAGIFVTLLALPALPFILGGTLATGVAGLLHPALGQLAGLLAWVPLTYLIGLVSWMPAPTVSGSWVGLPLVGTWYTLLVGLLLTFRPGGGQSRMHRWLISRRQWFKGRVAAPGSARTATGYIGVSGLLVLGIWFLMGQVLSEADGRLHVYFFDVGQGDSALIVTPGGRQVLVDGGPQALSAVTSLSGVLPAGDRSLDLVALTHMDSDHSRGLLEVLSRFQVGAVLEGRNNQAGELLPRWRAALDREQIDVITVQSAYRIELEPGTTLEVLNPPRDPIGGAWKEANNNGLVLRLVYGQVSFLLAADIEALAENYLVGQSDTLDSAVLKAGHHGSSTSTTPPFLSRVNPMVAVISAGESNRFGHPSQEVLDRLVEVVGEEGVYRTDTDGRIEFISDGQRLWVRTQY